MPVLVIWTEHEGENWPTSWFHGLCHPECHPAAYTKPRNSSEMPQKIANVGANPRAENGRWRPRFLTAKSVPLPCRVSLDFASLQSRHRPFPPNQSEIRLYYLGNTALHQ